MLSAARIAADSRADWAFRRCASCRFDGACCGNSIPAGSCALSNVVGDDFTDTGYAAEVGLRVLVTPTFEVSGAAEWVDVHDSDAGLKLGVRHDLTNSLSITARAEFVGQDETFAAGLRLAF